MPLIKNVPQKTILKLIKSKGWHSIASIMKVIRMRGLLLMSIVMPTKRRERLILTTIMMTTKWKGELSIMILKGRLTLVNITPLTKKN